ncbi:MAG: 2-dehydropantoate 2-reductase [Proteobacteria bacterium]|nr:2-dehydropantoate 2-reductase [Pseudomonadota bacterium]
MGKFNPSEQASRKIAIWGAGAIGGTVGAHLRKAGADVLLVDRDAAHVDAIRRRGLAITGPIANFRVEAMAATPERVEGVFDTILLAVKSQDTSGAVAALRPHLALEGAVVSLQNGLNEPEIAALVGPERTVGAFVNFAADLIQHGRIHYAGTGTLVLGELDGRLSPRIEALRAMLGAFDRNAKISGNINGYLWSKQAYGVLLKASALTNLSVVDFLASPQWRALNVALVSEIVAAAAEIGVVLEAFDGFRPEAFRKGAAPQAIERCFAEMVEHNQHSAKTHSGIWRDLAVRKRRTEVAAQLQPVIAAGQSNSVAMPLARRLVQLIGEVEAGTRGQGPENLTALAAALAAAGAGCGEPVAGAGDIRGG